MTPMTFAERLEPPIDAAERPMLEGWLDYHRETLIAKCAGLTDARHNGHADLVRERVDGATGV